MTEHKISEVIEIAAVRKQKRLLESFEASIRESWPGPIILQARRAIKEQDYELLDQILARLERFV